MVTYVQPSASLQLCLCIHAPLTSSVLLAVHGHVKSSCACSFSALSLDTRSSDLDRSSGRGAFPCCLYMLLLPRLSFWLWPRKSSRLQLFSSVCSFSALLLWPGPCHSNLGRQHILLGPCRCRPSSFGFSRSGPFQLGGFRLERKSPFPRFGHFHLLLRRTASASCWSAV